MNTYDSKPVQGGVLINRYFAALLSPITKA
jgi:hypothetical protein